MTAPSRSLKELFLAALEVGPEDRVAWLEHECAADAGLREHVSSMLAAHDAQQSLLDRPAADAPAGSLPPGRSGAKVDPSVQEGPGTVIADKYKLLEEIGEGGFGVVFMAEQTEPIRRKVALKVLKPGMDTRQVVSRFEAERQALAMMDHANIAKVFDGGATASGRPYFVMELVKGVPITEFCDRNHLAPRQRLALFITVCQAVQHAHQKGIIHRDLKPSNILVTMHDVTPIPKIIDFGVAKALGKELTDKTLFTGFAEMVGTPIYMSPEQAGQSGLDIDTRSDIYSLGVLLYELLTGTTPFDKERFKQSAYDEIRRIIREEEPPKPSTRLGDSGGTLASISANRHMEPAKLTKLVRGELDWIVMKTLEKDRNRRYETAKDFGADVQRYLDDEPVLACPPSAGYRLRKFTRLHKGPVLAAGLVWVVLIGGIVATTWQALRAMNAEAAALTERDLADQQRAKAEANFQIAKKAQIDYFSNAAYHAGRRFKALGHLGDSLAFYQQGLVLVEQLVHNYPNEIEFQGHVCNILGEMSLLHEDAGRLPEAIAALEKALPICERCAKEKPREASLLVRFSRRLAKLYRKAGRIADADRLYLALSKRSVELLVREPSYVLFNHVGGLHLDNGAFDDAIAAFNNAILVNIKSVPAHYGLGLAFQMKGQLDDAIAAFRAAVRLNPNHLDARRNLGLCLHEQGRLEEAIDVYRQALVKDVKHVPAKTDNLPTLITMNNLAAAYRQAGRLDEALVLDEETFQLTKAKQGPDGLDTLDTMLGLGITLALQKKHADAETLLSECWRLLKKKSPEDYKTHWAQSALGYCLLGKKEHVQAEPLLLQGYAGMKERQAKTQHSHLYRLSDPLDWIIELYDEWGQPENAKKWRDERLAIGREQKKTPEVKKNGR